MDSPSYLSGGPIHASSCKIEDATPGAWGNMNIAGSQEITIDLDSVTVWRMISDVTRTWEWSPDVIHSAWLDPGPTVGARFESSNRMPIVRRWRSLSTVTAADPGRRFAFAVGSNPDDPNTTWTWDLEPTSEGTTVRLSYEMRHEPPIVLLYYRLTRRSERVRESVAATLRRLKAVAEGPTPDLGLAPPDA
jgi:Polyketide cyclase / dehydrase and lipid transport